MSSLRLPVCRCPGRAKPLVLGTPSPSQLVSLAASITSSPPSPPFRTLDTIQKRSRNAPSHGQCITPHMSPPPTTGLTVEPTEGHSCIGPSISCPSPRQCRDLRPPQSKPSPPAGAMAAAYRFPISPCRLFNSPLAAQLALGKRSGPLPGRAAVALLSHSGRTRPPLPWDIALPFCVAFPDVATILAPRSLPRAVVFQKMEAKATAIRSGSGPRPHRPCLVLSSVQCQFFGRRRFWQRVAHVVPDSIWTCKPLLHCRIKGPVLVTLACF